MAAGAKLIASLLAIYALCIGLRSIPVATSSPVEGSVLTVNKNTGDIMFSPTPGLYSVMNLERANKMHSRSTFARSNTTGGLFEFSGEKGTNGYKPCYRKRSERKCFEGTLGVDFGRRFWLPKRHFFDVVLRFRGRVFFVWFLTVILFNVRSV